MVDIFACLRVILCLPEEQALAARNEARSYGRLLTGEYPSYFPLGSCVETETSDRYLEFCQKRHAVRVSSLGTA